ncbi:MULTISPECIES: hypothetical protein [Oleiagrimonas]|uniref:Uncharacterized protein n=1 Tax=Oleiagrimonas citrea TaxID=1665687 RepID=A0A846ZRE8_9GAMM|nr:MULTISPECIES: hypothetical protein [Oleiagrimonas]NKZ39971.1 hypothetical protein [Oleiagrimonas citrea]RAP57039.1 hypothetical protein BTJ49_12795 [Oleiagrimonas sp. MCCC 1A03011]
MKTSLSLVTVALGFAGVSAQVQAMEHAPAANGMSEIGDEELAQMRGRWTPGGDSSSTVAYFGVTMNSSWTSTSGQQLQSAMTVGMSFDDQNTPTVTFQPTVTIVSTNPIPTTANGTTTTRSVDSSGLNNVSGLVQGVQVAGDANSADNVTSVTVRNERDVGTPSVAQQPGTTFTGQPQQSTVRDGNATATARIDGSGARVALSIAGQGQVQQWIRSGSLGQVIALGADGQRVHNSMQIDLVQRSLASNVSLSRDFAQSINQVRGIGLTY